MNTESREVPRPSLAWARCFRSDGFHISNGDTRAVDGAGLSGSGILGIWLWAHLAVFKWSTAQLGVVYIAVYSTMIRIDRGDGLSWR
jgi:hypothetical protein